MLRSVIGLIIFCSLSSSAQAENVEIYFETPSTNIFCVYRDNHGNEQANIDCVIGQFTPSFDANFARKTFDPITGNDETLCTPDKLERFIVRQGSSEAIAFCPSLDILGDPITDEQVFTLQYGQVFSRGGLTCQSTKKGLSCTNESGHGFFLSKARQSIF